MNSSSVSTKQATNGGERQPLVDQALLQSCLLVFYSMIMPFSVLGVVTNIINLKVLLAQNQSLDSCLISLVALSASDLVACAFVLPQSTCYLIKRFSRLEHFLIDNCMVFTSGHVTYVHIAFSRMTCWIMVYLSLERSLCVLVPLTVKARFKPKQAIMVIACIFIFFVLFHIPYAVNSGFVITFRSSKNSSAYLRSYITPLGEILITYLSEIVGSFILTTAAILLVTIATAIMLFQLNSARKWRQSLIPPQPVSKVATSLSAGSTKLAISAIVSSRTARSPPESRTAASLSHRETQMMKTVVAVTTIFIVCSLCGHAPSLAMQFVPGVTMTGFNRSLYNICFKVRYMGDVINASVNIFFYLKLSSKYREAFYKTFLSPRDS